MKLITSFKQLLLLFMANCLSVNRMTQRAVFLWFFFVEREQVIRFYSGLVKVPSSIFIQYLITYIIMKCCKWSEKENTTRIYLKILKLDTFISISALNDSIIDWDMLMFSCFSSFPAHSACYFKVHFITKILILFIHLAPRMVSQKPSTNLVITLACH